MDLDAFTALFARLGAPHPEGWASSQLNEGLPQLASFLFLRQAWRHVLPEGDRTWIDRSIRSATDDPDAPFSGEGHALAALRARGATDKELTDLVRNAQAELLSSFCALLADPGDLEEEVEAVDWALFQIDGQGAPIAHMGSLHEMVLETDPTGREGRPRT